MTHCVIASCDSVHAQFARRETHKMAQAAPKVKAEPVANGAEANALLETVRKVLLASIGAVALAQDEIEDFVNKLVERGQIAEQDGRKLLKDVMERRRKATEKAE